MTDEALQTPPIATDSAGDSKKRLILFAVVILFMIMVAMVPGWLARSITHELGGNFHVLVINESPSRIRGDVVVDGKVTTMELDAGARGRLRYYLKTKEPISLNLYENNKRTRSISVDGKNPSSAGEVQFRILESTVKIETLDKASEE